MAHGDETNIVGVFLMTRAVVPHMRAAGRGSIINLTINHETMVRRGFSPYGPSKAALAGNRGGAGAPPRAGQAERPADRRHRMAPPRLGAAPTYAVLAFPFTSGRWGMANHS
jgi:hypothetical protein